MVQMDFDGTDLGVELEGTAIFPHACKLPCAARIAKARIRIRGGKKKRKIFNLLFKFPASKCLASSYNASMHAIHAKREKRKKDIRKIEHMGLLLIVVLWWSLLRLLRFNTESLLPSFFASVNFHSDSCFRAVAPPLIATQVNYLSFHKWSFPQTSIVISTPTNR